MYLSPCLPPFGRRRQAYLSVNSVAGNKRDNGHANTFKIISLLTVLVSEPSIKKKLKKICGRNEGKTSGRKGRRGDKIHTGGSFTSYKIGIYLPRADGLYEFRVGRNDRGVIGSGFSINFKTL